MTGVVYPPHNRVPTAPRAACRTQTCPSRAVIRGWCEACARQQNHGKLTRPSASARGYTFEWRAYSLAWLVRFPLCGMQGDGSRSPENSRCTARGQDTPAVCVNHKVSPKQGGAFWAPDNHESLCKGCNTRHARANGLIGHGLPDVEVSPVG